MPWPRFFFDWPEMAWSGTARESINDSVDRSTYSSGSYTPLADRLLVLFLHYGKDTGSATPPNCTVSGNGLTWQEVLTQGQANHRWSMWVAKTGASPSAGALSLAIGATQDYCQASIIEVEGADLSGTALAAIAQSKFGQFGQATSGSMALDAAPASTSRCVAMWVKFDTGGVTPRANWTEIHDLGLAGMGLETQMRVDAAEQTSSGSWVDNDWNQCLLAEIKGVAEGPTLISASDTPTLSVTESPNLLASLAPSDSPTMSVVETPTLLAALNPSDISALSLDEALTLLGLLAVSDLPSAAVTDSSAIVAVISGSDTASLSVTELVDLLASLSVADSPSISLVEALDLLAPLQVTDAPGVTISEATSIAVVLTSSDSGSLSLTEAVSLLAQLALSDSPSVTLTEALTILGSLAVSDSPAVGVTDSVGVAVLIVSADVVTAGVSEATTVQVVLSPTDILTLGVSELVTILGSVAVVDSWTLAISDTGVVVILGVVQAPYLDLISSLRDEAESLLRDELIASIPDDLE
jgi:hypothetical protein